MYLASDVEEHVTGRVERGKAWEGKEYRRNSGSTEDPISSCHHVKDNL